MTIYGYIFYSGSEAKQLWNSLLSTVIPWQKAFRRYDFKAPNEIKDKP